MEKILGIGLELKDWKDAETVAKEQIRQNMLAIELNQEVLTKARIEITRMEGEATTAKVAEQGIPSDTQAKQLFPAGEPGGKCLKEMEVQCNCSRCKNL